MYSRFATVDRGVNSGSISSSPVATAWNLQLRITNKQLERVLYSAIVAAGMIGLCGCSAPHRTWTPPRDPAQLDDVAFLHYLATVPTVTFDEGSQAVLLLIGPRERWPTFEKRFAELERRGAAKSNWHLSPNATLDMGTLAFMLRTLCELPPSVNDVLANCTGLGDRRYALRTCLYHGLLSHYTRPNAPVTGGELLSAISAAESRVVTQRAGKS